MLYDVADEASAPPSGVVVSAELAGPVWRLMRGELDRRRVDGGGRVRPEVVRLLEELRAAALQHEIGRGHRPRPVADIGASCEHVSTARAAGLLQVSDRHVRRLMAGSGYRPVRRGVWRAADVAALAAAREEQA